MNANDKYPVRDCENSLNPVQMQLSPKLRIFSGLFVPFLETTLNFEHWSKKRWSSYLLYFENYRLSKTWLDHSLKNTVSDHPLAVNMLKVKVSQSLVKCAWEDFQYIFSHHWENLIWKISALVISEILGFLGKIFTANDKYPVRDCENFLTLLQMQLSTKNKNFSWFLWSIAENYIKF